ncbi:MAG TPA: PTS sugar transporter subunit IIB [Syntrophales bacterium]|nr:PTS sugar transporter subunit IIB [Syntrophales bacterium]
MDPSLIRIDNRLVHGQILEAWVPFIGASHIVVVNDDVANDLFRESVIKMAVPREIETRVYSIEKFSTGLAYKNYTEKRSIILFSTIEDLLRAYKLGFRFDRLNIGNIHNDDCICQPTMSISLNKSNMEDLMLLANSGIKIEIRCVPRDRPVDFLEVVKKYRNSQYNIHHRP